MSRQTPSPEFDITDPSMLAEFGRSSNIDERTIFGTPEPQAASTVGRLARKSRQVDTERIALGSFLDDLAETSPPVNVDQLGLINIELSDLDLTQKGISKSRTGGNGMENREQFSRLMLPSNQEDPLGASGRSSRSSMGLLSLDGMQDLDQSGLILPSPEKQPPPTLNSHNPTPLDHNRNPLGHNPTPTGHKPTPLGHNPTPMGHNPTPLGSMRKTDTPFTFGETPLASTIRKKTDIPGLPQPRNINLVNTGAPPIEETDVDASIHEVQFEDDELKDFDDDFSDLDNNSTFTEDNKSDPHLNFEGHQGRDQGQGHEFQGEGQSILDDSMNQGTDKQNEMSESLRQFLSNEKLLASPSQQHLVGKAQQFPDYNLLDKIPVSEAQPQRHFPDYSTMDRPCAEGNGSDEHPPTSIYGQGPLSRYNLQRPVSSRPPGGYRGRGSGSDLDTEDELEAIQQEQDDLVRRRGDRSRGDGQHQNTRPGLVGGSSDENESQGLNDRHGDMNVRQSAEGDIAIPSPVPGDGGGGGDGSSGHESDDGLMSQSSVHSSTGSHPLGAFPQQTTFDILRGLGIGASEAEQNNIQGTIRMQPQGTDLEWEPNNRQVRFASTMDVRMRTLSGASIDHEEGASSLGNNTRPGPQDQEPASTQDEPESMLAAHFLLPSNQGRRDGDVTEYTMDASSFQWSQAYPGDSGDRNKGPMPDGENEDIFQARPSLGSFGNASSPPGGAAVDLTFSPRSSLAGSNFSLGAFVPENPIEDNNNPGIFLDDKGEGVTNLAFKDTFLQEALAQQVALGQQFQDFTPGGNSFPNEAEQSFNNEEFFSKGDGLAMLEEDQNQFEKENVFVQEEQMQESVHQNPDESWAYKTSEHFHERPSWLSPKESSDRSDFMRISIGRFIGGRTEALGSLGDSAAAERPTFGSNIVTPPGNRKPVPLIQSSPRLSNILEGQGQGDSQGQGVKVDYVRRSGVGSDIEGDQTLHSSDIAHVEMGQNSTLNSTLTATDATTADRETDPYAMHNKQGTGVNKLNSNSEKFDDAANIMKPDTMTHQMKDSRIDKKDDILKTPDTMSHQVKDSRIDNQSVRFNMEDTQTPETPSITDKEIESITGRSSTNSSDTYSSDERSRSVTPTDTSIVNKTGVMNISSVSKLIQTASSKAKPEELSKMIFAMSQAKATEKHKQQQMKLQTIKDANKQLFDQREVAGTADVSTNTTINKEAIGTAKSGTIENGLKTKSSLDRSLGGNSSTTNEPTKTYKKPTIQSETSAIDLTADTSSDSFDKIQPLHTSPHDTAQWSSPRMSSIYNKGTEQHEETLKIDNENHIIEPRKLFKEESAKKSQRESNGNIPETLPAVSKSDNKDVSRYSGSRDSFKNKLDSRPNNAQSRSRDTERSTKPVKSQIPSSNGGVYPSGKVKEVSDHNTQPSGANLKTYKPSNTSNSNETSDFLEPVTSASELKNSRREYMVGSSKPSQRLRENPPMDIGQMPSADGSQMSIQNAPQVPINERKSFGKNKAQRSNQQPSNNEDMAQKNIVGSGSRSSKDQRSKTNIYQGSRVGAYQGSLPEDMHRLSKDRGSVESQKSVQNYSQQSVSQESQRSLAGENQRSVSRESQMSLASGRSSGLTMSELSSGSSLTMVTQTDAGLSSYDRSSQFSSQSSATEKALDKPSSYLQVNRDPIRSTTSPESEISESSVGNDTSGSSAGNKEKLNSMISGNYEISKDIKRLSTKMDSFEISSKQVSEKSVNVAMETHQEVRDTQTTPEVQTGAPTDARATLEQLHKRLRLASTPRYASGVVTDNTSPDYISRISGFGDDSHMFTSPLESSTSTSHISPSPQQQKYKNSQQPGTSSDQLSKHIENIKQSPKYSPKSFERSSSESSLDSLVGQKKSPSNQRHRANLSDKLSTSSDVKNNLNKLSPSRSQISSQISGESTTSQSIQDSHTTKQSYHTENVTAEVPNPRSMPAPFNGEFQSSNAYIGQTPGFVSSNAYGQSRGNVYLGDTLNSVQGAQLLGHTVPPISAFQHDFLPHASQSIPTLLTSQSLSSTSLASSYLTNRPPRTTRPLSAQEYQTSYNAANIPKRPASKLDHHSNQVPSISHNYNTYGYSGMGTPLVHGETPLSHGHAQTLPGNGHTYLTPSSMHSLMSHPMGSSTASYNTFTHPVFPSIQAPGQLRIPEVCCVHLSSTVSLPITNPTTRWLKCVLTIIALNVNGQNRDERAYVPFVIKQKTMIEPNSKEDIKIIFSPRQPGVHVGELQILATSIVGDNATEESLPVRVNLQAVAEVPNIELERPLPSSMPVRLDSDTLAQACDFGELPWGSEHSMAIKIYNKGRANVPVRITINANSSWHCFSLKSSRGSLLHMVLRGQQHEVESAHLEETVTILFKAPQRKVDKRYLDMPAERLTASLNVCLDHPSKSELLGSMELVAIAGTARIHAPKSLDTIVLHTSQDQPVTEVLPLLNKGNIQLRVSLSVTDETQYFTVLPSTLCIKPEEEADVVVKFNPKKIKQSLSSTLLVMVEPAGPAYEMELRGEVASSSSKTSKYTGALPTAKGGRVSHSRTSTLKGISHDAPEVDDTSHKDIRRNTSVEPHREKKEEGLLSNKQFLSWGGVPVGDAMPQKVSLINKTSSMMKLTAQIKSNTTDFQFQCRYGHVEELTNKRELILKPGEEYDIYVVFCPSSLASVKSKLRIKVISDVKPTAYSLPLMGYGGVCNILLEDTNSAGFHNNAVNLGNLIIGNEHVARVKVRNIGARAGYVKALCFTETACRIRLPFTKASVEPSEFILQPDESKVCLVSFRPANRDCVLCRDGPTMVAVVAFYYGDALAKGKFRKSLQKSRHKPPVPSQALRDVDFDVTYLGESNLDDNTRNPDLSPNDLDLFYNTMSSKIVSLVGESHDDTTGGGGSIPQGVGMFEGMGPLPLDDSAMTVMDDTRRATLEPTFHRASMLPQSSRDVMPSMPSPPVKETSAPSVGRYSAPQMAASTDTQSDWLIRPPQIILPAPKKDGPLQTERLLQRVQIVNYKDTTLRFDLLWPGHCLQVTPEQGEVQSKSSTIVCISASASIHKNNVKLPWKGTVQVNVDGQFKPLSVQIRPDLSLDSASMNSDLEQLSLAKMPSTPLVAVATANQKDGDNLKVTNTKLVLPPVPIGKDSESKLEIQNISRDAVSWSIVATSAAYCKNMTTGEDTTRITYSVFRFVRNHGVLQPQQDIAVPVSFMPQSEGEYSQVMELRTKSNAAVAAGEHNIKVFLVGEGYFESDESRERWQSRGNHSSGRMNRSSLDKIVAPSRRSLDNRSGGRDSWLKKDILTFPDTVLNGKNTCKLELKNSTDSPHTLEVISPQPPYYVSHNKIKVKAGHFARLPVDYRPTTLGEHRTLLVLRIDTG
ncbi:unnamed protein product, partial [Owenia fusiformis]